MYYANNKLFVFSNLQLKIRCPHLNSPKDYLSWTFEMFGCSVLNPKMSKPTL